MHMHTVDEKISPIAAAHREHGLHKFAEELSRRHWRKHKRNGGRKVKTLREHRRNAVTFRDLAFV